MYMPMRKLRHLVIAAAAGVAATTAACSGDPLSQPAGRLAPDATADFTAADAGNSPQNSLLATVRGATARYHDVDAALADGYVLGSPCEAMPGQGIGVHYRKGSLIDGVVDPAQPELLVYEPQQNGRLQLVAVAFVVRGTRLTTTRRCLAIRCSKTSAFLIGAVRRSRPMSCTCGFGNTIQAACTIRRTRW